MTCYTSKREAMLAVVEILRQHLPLIPGVQGGSDRKLADLVQDAETERDWMNVEWNRSFGVGASLSVALHSAGSDRDGDRRVARKRAQVGVSWSGMTRTPAEATAALALYQQVAQLACLVEAALARMEIGDVAK